MPIQQIWHTDCLRVSVHATKVLMDDDGHKFSGQIYHFRSIYDLETTRRCQIAQLPRLNPSPR